MLLLREEPPGRRRVIAPSGRIGWRVVTGKGQGSDPGRDAPRAARVLGALPAPLLIVSADMVAILVVWLLSGRPSATVVAGALTVAAMAAQGLYRPRLTHSIIDVLPVVLRSLCAGLGLGVLLLSQISGAWTIAGRLTHEVADLLIALLLARWAAYSCIYAFRRRGWTSHRTLIVGGGEVASRVARALKEHSGYGLDVVAFIDPEPLPTARDSLPQLSPTPILSEAIRELRITVVIIAFSSVGEAEMVKIIRTCDRLDCTLFVVPRLFDVGGHDVGTVEHVWGVPLLRLRRTGFRPVARACKRAFDAVVSAVALLLLSPVLLAVAAAVRIGIGPGVVFRQVRLGADGREFTMYKFRTLPQLPDSVAPWSITEHPGITQVGRFLRRTSIDELPQLVNVLLGQMSLVGPRPERPHFASKFAQLYPSYEARHRMRSGMTGAAQVNGLRGDTSIEDRARFDNAYIDNWTMWGDIKIICHTLAQVLGARGA